MLETEQACRQAEPIIAISGAGWQHLVENPDIAELWGAAAYLARPSPTSRLLTWSSDRFSIVRWARDSAAALSP